MADAPVSDRVAEITGSHADHPEPWRSEPAGRPGLWKVLDARGDLVATSLGTEMADLLVHLPQLARLAAAAAAPGEVVIAARDAIQHVLRRATTDVEGLGRHLCPLTESWGLLTAAEAQITGERLDVVRNQWRLRRERSGRVR